MQCPSVSKRFALQLCSPARCPERTIAGTLEIFPIAQSFRVTNSKQGFDCTFHSFGSVGGMMSLFKKWWGRGTKSSTFCQHLPSTLAGGLWVSETEKSINGENPASHLGPQPVSDLELCLITHCSLCLINRSCHTHRSTISL